MVRSDPTADASLAAIFDLIRFGMAIAAMIRMIATTIRSSISEKPLCFFISILFSLIILFIFQPAGAGCPLPPVEHVALTCYWRGAAVLSHVPVVTQRITPLSSEQKERVPVVPAFIGVALDVYWAYGSGY